MYILRRFLHARLSMRENKLQEKEKPNFSNQSNPTANNIFRPDVKSETIKTCLEWYLA